MLLTGGKRDYPRVKAERRGHVTLPNAPTIRPGTSVLVNKGVLEYYEIEGLLIIVQP